MDQISYEGLDEATLIHGLYHGTRALGMGLLRDQPGLRIEQVREFDLTPNQFGRIHIDYLGGRPLKVEIDTKAKTVTTRLYDRDAGAGGCARVVEALRARQSSP